MDNYIDYFESKFDAGSCIKMPETKYLENKISITENFTKIKIDNIETQLKYATTTENIIEYNYGGILGPQKTKEISEIFTLSNGEILESVWVVKHGTNTVFDKIKFRNREYRPRSNNYEKKYVKYKNKYIQLKKNNMP